MGMLTKLMKDMIIPVKELFTSQCTGLHLHFSFRGTKQVRLRSIYKTV